MRVAIAAQVAAVVAISLSSSTVEAQSGDSIATCGPECTTEARTDSASGDRGWLVAFSAGVPGYGREAAAELMTIGVQWTRAAPIASVPTSPSAPCRAP